MCLPARDTTGCRGRPVCLPIRGQKSGAGVPEL